MMLILVVALITGTEWTEKKLSFRRSPVER
jgi:hypothetical protein